MYGYLGPNGAGKTTSLRMMLGLIRPTEGTSGCSGATRWRRVRALEGVAGFVEAPTFYPYLTARRNLELLAAFDGNDARKRIDQALDTVELERPGEPTRSAATRTGCASGWGSPRRCCATPSCCCSTSRPPGSTRRVCATCGVLIRQLADQGMTVVLSSHLLAEVEEVCNRVAIVRTGKIVYEGEIAELKRGAGTVYRLETTDDERALAVCRAQPGIEDVHAEHGRIAFKADEAAAAELSQALIEAGALIQVLTPQTVTLEDLFFSLTEGVDGAEPPAGRGAAGRRPWRARMRPGVGTVYRWELRKLRYPEADLPRARARRCSCRSCSWSRSTSATTATAATSPSPPTCTRSGLAVPLVLLLFGAVWLFPLITALVAGDIIASEDHNGTLKTIFTRSLERGQIFAGKALAAATYGVAAIMLSGTVAVIAGSLQSGFNSLQTLSGTIVSAPKGLELVYVGLLVYLIPIATIVCIGLLLSSITRNSAAAVVGTLMISLLFQLIGILPGLGGLQPYLLSTQFNAWQGLLRTPIDWSPIVRAAWVCAMYGIPAIFAAYLVFLRRDVAGG